MDPEIAQAFSRSVNVSTTNGSAAHLLKAGSKRRRTQAELKEQYEMDALDHIEKVDNESKINEL